MDELENIQSKIYVIRGQRVMLDRDLASMYGVETKVLNQAVKRNIERFPEDFMFQLTKGEYEILTSSILRSQIVTANIEDDKGDYNLRSQIVTAKEFTMSRTLPYAFTEHGVAMLSSVTKSLPTPTTYEDIAQLRKDFEELKLDIEDILHDQNDINESTRAQLDAISTALAELQANRPDNKPRRPIGFIKPKDDED